LVVPFLRKKSTYTFLGWNSRVLSLKSKIPEVVESMHLKKRPEVLALYHVAEFLLYVKTIEQDLQLAIIFMRFLNRI